MKKNTIIKLLPLVLVSLVMSGCSDFLDVTPDSRIELNTPDQISKLLVNGYSDGNYALINELGSDNFVDNNSPDSKGTYYNLSSFERMHDEMYAWEPAVSSSDQDSPTSIWTGCYHAIAVANQALEAIQKFENEGRGAEVAASKGEALMIRAYHHFILVNEFCQVYKNETLSAADPGVPYITTPESKVLVDYDRSNVAAVYDSIETDMLAGLALINNTAYTVPKYHFNKQAALAFAARFYLFKREYQKVVDYATEALGSNPADYMRDWSVDYSSYTSFAYGWINASSANNFLLIPTVSWLNRVFGTRYGCNRDASKGTIYGSGPTWQNYNFHPCYNGRLYLRGSVEYGVFFPKCGEFFEYSDKIAGIGYGHVIRAEFTGEETLLCRAEAYVFLNRISDAVADLKIFDDSRKMDGYEQTDLTESVIRSFYTSSRPLFVSTFHTNELSPDFYVTSQQKPILDCVLHFRRLETIFDGMRWFDLKRYGIEVTHKIGKDVVDVLTYDDPRRAHQIPAEVISAGMEPNYRATDTGGDSGIEKADVSLTN